MGAEILAGTTLLSPPNPSLVASVRHSSPGSLPCLSSLFVVPVVGESRCMPSRGINVAAAGEWSEG